MKVLTLLLIISELLYLNDMKKIISESKNVPNIRTVISDENIDSSSATNHLRLIRSSGIRSRCRRYVQTFYKTYDHIDSYVYNPYGPYIIPPNCIGTKCYSYCQRCPACCLKPCPYPTAVPIRTTYKPYRTTVRTTSKNTPTLWTKKGAFCY